MVKKVWSFILIIVFNRLWNNTVMDTQPFVMSQRAPKRCLNSPQFCSPSLRILLVSSQTAGLAAGCKHRAKSVQLPDTHSFCFFKNGYIMWPLTLAPSQPCSPLEKSAPWGKLSSWLCSASQEYMALASLKRQQKQTTNVTVDPSRRQWGVISRDGGGCGGRLTAPSDWSWLSRSGGALEKQRSGSDPEIQKGKSGKKKKDATAK